MSRYFIFDRLQLALHTLLQQLLLVILQSYLCFFVWMVNGIMFHTNGPLHKKLLENVTVREVKGRMCEDCLVS